MATDKKYSILTYNIGGYEIMHPIKCKSEIAEYVYVTDNKELKSDDWTMVYVDNNNPADNFDLLWTIRYNPFVFVNTDVVMKIDGSMEIVGNTDELYNRFIEGDYNACVMIHPHRNTMLEEYGAWIQMRQYPIEQANKCLGYMAAMEGYDIEKFKGLYQYNFMIQRNDRYNRNWNSMTYALLKYLAPINKAVDRLDQTIGSFVLNKYFDDGKIMTVSQEIIRGKYFNWCAHTTNLKMNVPSPTIEPYLFNKPVDNIFNG